MLVDAIDTVSDTGRTEVRRDLERARGRILAGLGR
jgi:hypothetical protein